jgi:hypothetical protein
MPGCELARFCQQRQLAEVSEGSEQLALRTRANASGGEGPACRTSEAAGCPIEGRPCRCEAMRARAFAALSKRLPPGECWALTRLAIVLFTSPHWWPFAQKGLHSFAEVLAEIAHQDEVLVGISRVLCPQAAHGFLRGT